MARGEASCTCAKCGAEFTKYAVRNNRREADRWAEWAAEYYTECEDCYAKRKAEEREAATAAAAEQANELGLPELTGSEKQIAWANRIRQSFCERILSDVEDMSEAVQDEVQTELVFFLKTFRTAREWIDFNGMTSFQQRVRYNEIVELMTLEEDTGVTAEEIAAEQEEEAAQLVLSPADKSYGSVAYISIGKRIEARYPRNDKFREIVKSLGYAWDGTVWAFNLDVTTGAPEHRAAELMNKLLREGFAVSCESEAARAMAVDGSYEPRYPRWISYLEGERLFVIRWGERSDALFSQAKRLSCAKWKNGAMQVPLKSYAEVEDFGKINSFRLTDGAQKAIDSFTTVVVEAAQVEEPVIDESHFLEDALSSSREILEDLID